MCVGGEWRKKKEEKKKKNTLRVGRMDNGKKGGE